jgi:hypothetical protein
LHDRHNPKIGSTVSTSSPHSLQILVSTNSPGFIGGLLGLSHRVAPEAILGPCRITVEVILSTEWAGVPCDVIGGLTLKARPVTGIQIIQAAPAGIPSAIVMYQPVIAMSHEVFVDDLPHVIHRWPPPPRRARCRPGPCRCGGREPSGMLRIALLTLLPIRGLPPAVCAPSNTYRTDAAVPVLESVIEWNTQLRSPCIEAGSVCTCSLPRLLFAENAIEVDHPCPLAPAFVITHHLGALLDRPAQLRVGLRLIEQQAGASIHLVHALR